MTPEPDFVNDIPVVVGHLPELLAQVRYDCVHTCVGIVHLQHVQRFYRVTAFCVQWGSAKPNSFEYQTRLLISFQMFFTACRNEWSRGCFSLKIVQSCSVKFLCKSPNIYIVIPPLIYSFCHMYHCNRSLFMLPVSPVLHNTEVTVSIGLKSSFREGTSIPQT